jgi:heterodisulfide reductase subunit C
VFRERRVFDPMWIIRMVAMGFREELFRSPSIWLCIDCQSCTHACPQRVRGHLVLRRVQELAYSTGFAHPEFPKRWRMAQQLIYSHFLVEVHRLFDLPVP